MTIAKHTPGPWSYVELGQQVWGRSVGGCRMEEADHLIADVRGWGHIQYLPNGAEVQDANGRLIAAAPELLEALQDMLAVHGVRWEHARGDSSIPTSWVELSEKARAAIAKATGGAA